MTRKSSVRISAFAAILTLTVALFASLPHPTLSAARRATPPDSYLRYKVYTVDQLVQQVQSNPRVRAVYARTFHIPEDRVVDYMRQNVVESYIPYTKTYTVYCVTSSGRIFAIHQVFRRGTKVFALRNGQPVFKWVCGNPLMNQLPTVKTMTKSVQTPAKVVTKVSPSAETLIPNQPAVELIPSEEVALLPTAPVITTAASGVSTITGPGGFPLWLPFLPLGFIHGGSNGSPGSTNTTGGPTTTSNTTVGPTTSTTSIGPTTTATTTTTAGPTTTATTTTTAGPTTTTNTTTIGPTTTNATTIGPTATITTGTTNTTGTTSVPEPSSSTSIAIGFVPLVLALLLSYRSTRKKRKADTPTK